MEKQQYEVAKLAEIGVMPSLDPPEPSQADTSALSTSVPANPARSIYAFWSNGGGPSQSIPASAPAKPRKRRKAYSSDTQAKLLGLNGAAWSIGKGEDAAILSGVSEAGLVGGKGRRTGGEEAERKEMAKRARQGAAAVEKAARRIGPLSGEEGPASGSNGISGEASAIPNLPTNGASSPSPGKRKRGRPPKIRQPTTSPPSLPSPDQAGLSNGHPSSSTDVIVTGHRLNPNLASHPYFSRTVSSSSKGASYDPIDVESPVRAGPRKLIFASDQKAAHSFFAAPHEVIAPVEVAVKGKAAKVYAFFEASDAKADSQGRIRDGWGRGLKEGGEWAAPWTGGIWPSHEGVSGPSSVSHCLKKATKHSKIRSRSDSSGKDYWEGIFRQALLLSRNGVSNSPHRSPQSLPPLCAQHPAWTSLRHKTGSVNRDSWCERYRPHRAEEVLGNEIEATYLRDWLRALQVGKGRKVVRKLKRPKRQLFDGRVTDDIGLFGDADEEEDEDELPEAFEEPELPLGERPNGYPPLATRLTNTILLTGPHGSGKSAAVYAAATELGWEVFEVYPGIGKRTGANLMTLVGDVGKNHMVVKGGLKEETDRNGAKRTFFDKAKEGEADLANGIQGSTTGLAAVGPDDKKGSDEAEVRQSLILIDEVDILFAEENTFWPAVLALIAESRRPVVLTCNDPQLVPRVQLPLQTILHFQPPPPHLAIPYLEAIASREGCLDMSALPILYAESTFHGLDIGDHPLPPNGHEPVPHFGLRRAITQMQFDRGTLSAPDDLKVDSREKNLGGLQRQLDVISFVDASIAPRTWAVMDINEIDRYNATMDDELAISALLKPELDDFRPTLPAHDRASDISGELVRLSGGSVSPQGNLQMARIEHIRSLLPALDPLIPLSSYLLPHQSVFTDYIPVIQQIVEADDTLEAAEEAELALGGNRVNRKTGRPRRLNAGVMGMEGCMEGCERYIDAGAGALCALRASVLHY